MPRVLAAFDPRWGDARTNITTYLQLYLNMDRRDDKADGVLNGPTTESWFDHWYRHLVALGVHFVRGAVKCLDPPAFDPTQPPHLRPRVQITLADGTRLAPDYTVVAVDAPAAERITSALRAAGTGGTVAGLDGFTTSAAPPDGPLQPESTRPRARRDPYAMDEMGRVPWDRFQTLSGIQYYFDTEFQLLRGHMYYAGTEWGLSSINQHGLWQSRPTLARDGHVSVLSVDIGDFNSRSRHLVDELGRGKAARDCTADEIAAEVWRQIVAALTSEVDNAAEELLPSPAWYALDRGLVMETGPGQGRGRVVRNETPYLVPIVGDWVNRPGEDPWNPHGTSWTSRPPEDWWLEDLEQRNVWQARHGGYQVHDNSVVFAGTWSKTFTRMTSMEAACESARHAVNAILDHYVWVASGGLDRRENTTLRWEFPYGFLDQGLSSPIRMPTPAGDYCYVFDIENREPADTRALRVLDSQYYQKSLPHPLDTPAPVGAPNVPVPSSPGGMAMTTSPLDYNQQLLAYLQAWRQLLEQSMTMAGTPFAVAPSAMPAVPPGMPFMPPMPPMPPAAPVPPVPPSPADYTQQLFGYLQAWRQYLEQVTGAAPGLLQPPFLQPPTSQPSDDRGGIDGSGESRRGHRTAEGQRREPVPGDDEWQGRGSSHSDSGYVDSGSGNVASRSDNRSSTVPPAYEAVRPINVGGSQVPWTSLFGRRAEARYSAEGIMPQAGAFRKQFDDLSRYVREPDAPRLTQDVAKPGAARDVPQAAQSLYAIASREGAPRARGSGAIGTRASATGWQRGPAHDRAPAPHDTPA